MFKKTIENNKEKFLNYLRKKSVERLTIMFIPHGNEKIYSFHLSFLTIIFLLFIFFSTFSISLYGYYRYKEISNKINELKNYTVEITRIHTRYKHLYLVFKK